MKKLKSIFTIALFVLAANATHAQWEQNTKWEGGHTYTMLNTSGAAYVGTSGGIFKSTDHATSWNFTGQNLALPEEQSYGLETIDLVATSTALFARNFNGVKRSTDGGASWDFIAKNTLQVQFGTPREIEVFNNNLFLSFDINRQETDSVKLFRSSDNGNSFTQVGTFANSSYNSRFYVVNNALYLLTDKIRVSTDGTNFSEVSTSGLPDTAQIISLTGTAGILVGFTAGDPGGQIYKFNGISWVLASTGIPPSNLILNVLQTDGVYFSTTGNPTSFAFEIYTSTDNATSWKKKDVSGLKINAIIQIAAFDANRILAASLYGLYVSANGGSTWAPANKGFYSTYHSKMLTSGNTLLFVDDLAGVIRSTDKGETFSASNQGLPTGLNEFETMIQSSDAFYLTLSQAIVDGEQKLFYSTDEGAGWKEVAIPQNMSLNLLGSNGTTIFCRNNNDGMYYRSTDRGANWTQLIMPPDVSYINKFFGDGTSLYVEGSGGNAPFRLSTDNGNTWQQDTAGLHSATGVYNEIFDGKSGRFFVAQQRSGINETILYVKENNKWKQLSVLSPGLNIYDLYEYKGIIYLIADAEIYASNDGGLNFYNYMNGMHNGMRIYSLAFIEDKIFAGTAGNGIWMGQTFTGPLGTANFTPFNGKLLQNYPNPASQQTTIHYEIATEGNVRIDLFDINGTWVKELANEHQTQGTYNLSVDINNLPAGVYTYRLSSQNASVSKKMVVVR